MSTADGEGVDVSFATDLQTILVATDGSPSAVEAIDFAAAFAATNDASLLVVHVARTIDYVSDDPDDDGYAVPHEPGAPEQRVLAVAAARAAEQGVTATTSLRLGSTVDEIVAYADACNVDLIIVGTRGHGPVASALLGSVSLGVLRRSTRPVVIVRGTVAPRATTNGPSGATTT